MVSRPTLHLTNWSSRAQHGPGRKLCAMARPRRWERGDGRCAMAAPAEADLPDLQRGRLTEAGYRAELVQLWARALPLGMLAPDCLGWRDHLSKLHRVQDGDSLLCSCPRPDSPRRTHQCHLEWLAPFLVRVGWDVVLYGRRLTAGGTRLSFATVWADNGDVYCV